MSGVRGSWCSTRGRSSEGGLRRFAIARPASWSTTASMSVRHTGKSPVFRRDRRIRPRGRSRRPSSCADRDRRRSVLRCPHACTAAPAGRRVRVGCHSTDGRAGALRLALPLLRARWQLRASQPVSVNPRNVTVQAWLDYHGQGLVLQEWLWHPLAVAALNQLPADASADAHVRILAEMFAPDPAAAAVVLPIRPLYRDGRRAGADVHHRSRRRRPDLGARTRARARRAGRGRKSATR